MSRPLAVGDLLATVFSGTPTERRLSEGKIWLIWDSAVGEQIAAKARPVSFRDGTLTVAVVSAPWMQQLSFLKKHIVEQVNQSLGRDLVREIYLKAVRAKAVPPQPKTAEKPRRQLTESEIRLIAEQTASVKDPELREAFTRILARDREARSGSDS
jgi:predicted nucleic acid-binding Zn ribbon protein